MEQGSKPTGYQHVSCANHSPKGSLLFLLHAQRTRGSAEVNNYPRAIGPASGWTSIQTKALLPYPYVPDRGPAGGLAPRSGPGYQHLAEQEAAQGLLVEPKLREGNGTHNKAGGSALSAPGQQHLGQDPSRKESQSPFPQTGLLGLRVGLSYRK